MQIQNQNLCVRDHNNVRTNITGCFDVMILVVLTFILTLLHYCNLDDQVPLVPMFYMGCIYEYVCSMQGRVSPQDTPIPIPITRYRAYNNKHCFYFHRDVPQRSIFSCYETSFKYNVCRQVLGVHFNCVVSEHGEVAAYTLLTIL